MELWVHELSLTVAVSPDPISLPIDSSSVLLVVTDDRRISCENDSSFEGVFGFSKVGSVVGVVNPRVTWRAQTR